MKPSLLFACVLCLCSSVNVSAQDLGTAGAAYTIAEKDGIDSLKDAAQKKLNEVGKQNMIDGAKQRQIDYLSNLPLLEGVGQVTEPRIRKVDISVVVDKDVLDTNGKVIVAKGTVLNPLKMKPLTKKVFFIDARSIPQLDLVKARASATDTVIVAAGSLFHAQKYLNRSLHIDHNPIGVMAKRMQIRFVPSIASQDGDLLKIEEIKL